MFDNLASILLPETFSPTSLRPLSTLSLRAIAKQSQHLLRSIPGLLRHFVPRNDYKRFEEGYKKHPVWFVVLVLVLFSACSDVVDVDLKHVEPQMVIDGTVTDQPGPYTVKISKTGDYYEPSRFSAVSGAIVKIADHTGYSETLQETEKGIYLTHSLQGIPGQTYTLTVIAEGKEYTAISTMPEAIEIDSLGYEYHPGASFGPDREEGYRLHVYFTDRAGIEDHCRFKAFKNGQLIKGYSLYKDKGGFNSQVQHFCRERW